MSTIQVPVINESPNTISVTFQSEYAVPFETANPDGVPSHCRVGGPGVIGGPEYVNLLQRGQVSSIPQSGYRYEVFELPKYPNHTFYSFKNFTTGIKNVVAFLKNVAATVEAGLASATVTSAGFATATSGQTGLTASIPDQTLLTGGPVTYAWGGTALTTGSPTGAITAGSGTRSITFTMMTGTVVGTTLWVDVTDEEGRTVRSNILTR
jgi:hypothetical protein